MTSNAEIIVDVVITKPGYDTVRIGPASEHQASTWTMRLEAGLHSTQHPEGTTFAVEPHQRDLRHTDPASIPHDEAALAEAIAAQPFSTDYGAMYPDLYTVLGMHLGDDEAGKLWLAACRYADAVAEREEAVAGLADSAKETLLVVGKLRHRIRDVNRLTDGDISSDADAELEIASRSLRNVQRIINEYLQ